MTDNDKMREAFEKWYLMQRVSHASHLKQESNGCYFGAHTETAWRAWQAAQPVPAPSAAMREAFIQACKEYGPTISFSDFELPDVQGRHHAKRYQADRPGNVALRGLWS